MAKKVTCKKCGRAFNCQQDLTTHLKRKFPCDKAKHKCKKCGRGLNTLNSKYTHEKSCAGKPATIDDKNAEIQRLHDVIAATNGLKTEIDSKQQIINNNNTQNNITINDIQNVTQNIVILPTGQEDISHLKAIPFDKLKEKLRFDRDPQTHIEAFKMIRLDPEHPENTNILLTDAEGDKVHYYCDEEHGWQEGPFQYQVRQAIYDVNKNLQSLIPFKEREGSEYYWNHLMRGIQDACNYRDDIALKPIFDGIRRPLHEATLRLIKIAPDEPEISDIVQAPSASCGSMSEQIELLKYQARVAESRQMEAAERTKEAAERTKEAAERTKQMQLEERTKQLQLELELARLKQVV